MQIRLKELGYDLGKYGIDGDFGSDTQAAVMKFQQDNGLEATGVYDAVTHEKLTGEHVINEPEKRVITGPTVEILTKNGGTVNVRFGNGTEYEIIKEVETGEMGIRRIFKGHLTVTPAADFSVAGVFLLAGRKKEFCVVYFINLYYISFVQCCLIKKHLYWGHIEL